MQRMQSVYHNAASLRTSSQKCFIWAILVWRCSPKNALRTENLGSVWTSSMQITNETIWSKPHNLSNFTNRDLRHHCFPRFLLYFQSHRIELFGGCGWISSLSPMKGWYFEIKVITCVVLHKQNKQPPREVTRGEIRILEGKSEPVGGIDGIVGSFYQGP